MITITFINEKNKTMTIHKGEKNITEEGYIFGRTCCGRTFDDTNIVDTDHASNSHNLHYCKRCYK